MQTRRLFGTFIAAVAVSAATLAHATTIAMAKSPYCGCCDEWAKQMRSAGFTVKIINVDNPGAIAAKLGVPDSLLACHTAKVGNYLVEGHVPAADIHRLLGEKPNAVGLAVPGMPAGSPGMGQMAPNQHYKTILFTRTQSSLFAAH